jgi:hypothetical protein
LHWQGYDAVALSGAGRFVVGLDVCDAAIQKAKQVTKVNNVLYYFCSSA